MTIYWRISKMPKTISMLLTRHKQKKLKPIYDFIDKAEEEHYREELQQDRAKKNVELAKLIKILKSLNKN